MTHPTEVILLLRDLARYEAEGQTGMNFEDVYSDEAIRYAEQNRLISMSIGSWQDDGQFCSLRNPGRLALGQPVRLTWWDRVDAAFAATLSNTSFKIAAAVFVLLIVVLLD